MKAILFPDRNKVDVIDLPDPKPGIGEVVVDVRASGICHTDIEVLRGNYGTSAFPVVPGHEYAGVVAEIGPGVTGIAVGDRVAIDPNLECGSCPACSRGWAHLCQSLGAYGVTCNGGFAERSVVKASAVHQIGDLSFEVAALAEPLGCVLNGLEAADAAKARNALIFGAGPMGMLLAIGLRVAGVSEVALVDVDEERLRFAEEFGFAALAAGSPDLSRWREGADLAVDATGVPQVAGALVGYVANGGAGLFFGVCPSDAKIEIRPFELFRRQVRLLGSHSLNHNIPEALHALKSFRGDLSKLVSHRLSLEEVGDVLAHKPIRGSLKVQAVFA